MNIAFKVDSSFSIGTGHVMRCMALAETLRNEGHEIVFLCRDLPGNRIPVLKDNGFNVISLPFNPKSQETLASLSEYQQWLGERPAIDLQQTITALLSLNHIHWLVVDHYGLANEFEIGCRNYVDKILVIDDLANRAHDCDILVDQNYYSYKENRYKNLINENCKKFIGPEYALLRAEFRKMRKDLKPRNDAVQTLLISLGGGNVNFIMEKVLQGISLSDCSNMKINIVLGSQNEKTKDLIEKYHQQGNYFFHFAVKNMAELMKNADVAVGAGGTTTWERCCMGLPSLLIQTADNQQEVIEQGCALALFDYIDELKLVNANDVAKKLNAFISNPEKLHKMSQLGMAVVDGWGASRIANAMFQNN